MDVLFGLVRHLPDSVILVTGAVVTAAVAVSVGWIARKFWFAERGGAIEEHTKLAELVHGSLLAFAVFVLALVLSDVRANLGKSDDAASREASLIGRLDRALAPVAAPAGPKMREDLRAYVTAVTADEWPMLAQRLPELSPKAGAVMETLWGDLGDIEARDPAKAVGLRGLLERLEDLRQGRLEAATKSVPRVFWWVISAFMLGVMLMNGRYRLNSMSFALIVTHMAGLGLVVSLILVMDEPFRGETSISPAPLANAVGLTLPR